MCYYLFKTWYFLFININYMKLVNAFKYMGYANELSDELKIHGLAFSAL